MRKPEYVSRVTGWTLVPATQGPQEIPNESATSLSLERTVWEADCSS